MDYQYEAVDPNLGRYYDGPNSMVPLIGRAVSKRDCPHPLPQSVYWGNQGGNYDPEYHREYASHFHKDTRNSIDFGAENWKAWTVVSVTAGLVQGKVWQHQIWQGWARAQSWGRSAPYMIFNAGLFYILFEHIRLRSLKERYNFDMSYLYDKALKVACHEGCVLGYEMYADPKKVGPYKYNPHHFTFHLYASP